MKKNLLTILSAITMISSVAVAQPTLTATGINPVAGDLLTLKNGPAVNPGSAGSNQTWVVNPTSSATPGTYTATSVGSTPYAASFSQANVSANYGGYYLYYNTSATALKNQGSYVGLTLSYSDPEDQLHFPFNMGNTYSDPWAVTFVNGGVTFVRTGTTTVTYDGYGSITLPNGTFSNAVRVHFVQVYKDTYSGGTINYNNDEYMWYINGNHYPVAVTYTLTNSSSGTPSTGSAILTNAVAASVYEHESIFSAVSVFPNPAVNEINFDFKGIPTSSIEIFDITGKSVYHQIVTETYLENYITINTSEFKDGIYFAKFTSKDGQTGTKKISITK